MRWWGVIALTFLAAIYGISYFRLSLDDLDKIGSIVAALTGLVTLWIALRARTRNKRMSMAEFSAAERLASARHRLAEVVELQWRREALMRSVDDPRPMPIKWRLAAGNAVDHVENISDNGPFTFSASSDGVEHLVDWLRELPRTRLIVLGDAGTGKTTLAVQVVRQLLAVRRPVDPVPVLLTASSWDPGIHPSVHEWVAERLQQEYPELRTPDLGPEIPLILAGGGHILPVIDGVDELPASTSADIILAINSSLLDADDLIVTSRTIEFEEAIRAAGRTITGAVAIEPESITPYAAADYLRRCLPRYPGTEWEVALHLLGESTTDSGALSAMAATTSTALGLWLVRSVYVTGARRDLQTRPTPDKLFEFRSATALRKHLFDHLMEALIERRDAAGNGASPFLPVKRRDPADAQRWLSFLASHMRDGGGAVRDFHWWRLGLDIGPVSHTVQFVLALPVGASVGLACALLFGPGLGPRGWLALGLASFTFGTLAAASAIGYLTSFPQKPGYADFRIRGRVKIMFRSAFRGIRSSVADGVYVGGLIGLLMELIVDVDDVFFALVLVGVLFGAAIGVVKGLIEWAESPTDVARLTSPLESWRRDRKLFLLRFVVGGLLGAGIGGAQGSAIGGLPHGLAYALSVGLAAALVSCLAGNSHAWLQYSLAVPRLSRGGRLPRDLMPFLDDAHRLGVLRAVGSVYQFRHAELQDYFADSNKGAVSHQRRR
jgi:hypothetical protein